MKKVTAYNCDDDFIKGTKYLIFGKINEHGKLWTSVCYANTRIDNEAELEFIKNYL